jgi:homoserine O-acetyltransferase
MFMMQSVPLQQQKQYPTREAAEQAATQTINQRLRSVDANDFIYQYEASRDYDPSVPGKLEKIIAPVLAINSADDQVNPPELGLVEKFLPAREARQVRADPHQRSDPRPRHAFAPRDLGAVSG